MKTFIKWQGNKTRSIKHILPRIPTFNTYFEPFLGSGALFLSLAPQKWLINDINSDLYRVWKAIFDSPKLFFKHYNFYTGYLSKLDRDDLLIECKRLVETLNTNKKRNVKRTVLYLILKCLVYQGHLFMKNKHVFYGFDTNIHTYDNIYLFSEKYSKNIKNVSNYLNKNHTDGSFSLHNSDYIEVLKLCKAGDFVFLDPPYVEDHDYKFHYNKGEILNDKFFEDMLKEVRKLDRKKVKWLMTQADTSRIRELFKDYEISSFPIYRIAQKNFVNELIIQNYSQ